MPSTVRLLRGGCKAIGAACGGISREQIRQALPALARGDEALPIGDGEVDRRQRARAQDRAGDDDARGRLLVDHQLGADGKNADCSIMRSTLDTEPKPPATSLARRWLIIYFAIGIAPMRRDAAGHAHGRDHLGVAAAGLGEDVARRRMACRRPGRFAGHDFGHVREHDRG